jgi:midasin
LTIQTKRTKFNSIILDLVKIVEAIGANRPIMLEGPMGCGKTKLVEQIAKLAGRKEFERFHRVYMSDRTDGRSLVGGYTCHDVPGNFSWEDGVLTKYVN